MNNIFLVSGRAGAGKGAVSKILCKLMSAREVAFAEPMKRWAIQYFDFEPWECYNSEEEARQAGWSSLIMGRSDVKYGKTPESRRFLQRLGDLMKDVHCRSYWADRASEVLEGYFDCEDSVNAVISDWRFPYELETIRDDFDYEYTTTYAIRVIRSDLPKIEAGSGHVSETSLTDRMVQSYDKVFHNNSTIEELEKQVLGWTKEISPGEAPKPSSLK
jgi:hypothetical protein